MVQRPTLAESWLYLGVLVGYLLLLYLYSWWSNRGKAANLHQFAQAGGQAPWLLVAYGMVGASLSGVTFLSVPGWVAASGMSYLQVVLGYLVGYGVIIAVLLPLYYRGRYLSIYQFLEQRFGRNAQRSGAFFFLLSRSLGAAARLYLAAVVLHTLVFGPMGIPFWVVAVAGPLIIWLYTRRGGLGTVIWTDVLQTTLMLAVVAVAAGAILLELPPEWLQPPRLPGSYTQWLVLEPGRSDFFPKHFLSGALIALVMTGLDQDMMQKNLSCRSLRAAQWNVGVFSGVLLLVNLGFLWLGVLLYQYADWSQLALPARSDAVFALLATQEFGLGVAILFVLGLTAAAYSSADGSLTALTSSTLVDLLGHRRPTGPQADQQHRQLRLQRGLHLAYTLLFILLLLGFRAAENLGNQAEAGPPPVIDLVLSLAGYTYGPLLGLYAFGLLHPRAPVRDRWIPLLALLAPLLSWGLKMALTRWAPAWDPGYALLAVNGLLMYLGLWLLAAPRRAQARPESFSAPGG